MPYTNQIGGEQMIKYKNEYKVIQQKDSNGIAENKDDTYIPCRRKAQIYRYSDDTLGIMFLTTIYSNNCIAELSALNIEMTLYQDGNAESTYLFKESDLSAVAEVVQAKKRIKRNLTPEQSEVLRLRMVSMRENIQNRGKYIK